MGNRTVPRLTRDVISAVRSLSINTTKGKRRSLLTSCRSVTFSHVRKLPALLSQVSSDVLPEVKASGDQRKRTVSLKSKARRNLASRLILLTSPKATKLAQRLPYFLFS